MKALRFFNGFAGFLNGDFIPKLLQEFNSGGVFKVAFTVSAQVHPEGGILAGSGQVNITTHQFRYGLFDCHKAKVRKLCNKLLQINLVGM